MLRVVQCRFLGWKFMDFKTLKQLYANLSLDKNPPPMLEVDETTIASRKTSLRQPSCREGFVAGQNRFVFSFSCIQEKRRSLNDGPWHFNKSLIAFEELEITKPSELRFQYAMFWVQVHNIRVVCISERIGLKIGS